MMIEIILTTLQATERLNDKDFKLFNFPLWEHMWVAACVAKSRFTPATHKIWRQKTTSPPAGEI